jgi:uncharacterized cupredoxin-like copper-binding protein
MTPIARWRSGLVLSAAFFALTAAGCGGDSGSSGSSQGEAVSSTDATEKDFAIDLANTSLASGQVTFHITNDGPSVHEFVVFKTDLDEGDLPTTKDDEGNEIVDEEGEGVEHIDEVEDIKVDSSQDLDVSLDPGDYVVLCNLPGHYAAGMHSSFSVE